MRRHLRKVLRGVGVLVFVLLLSPFECVHNYCHRHNFNPPICDEVFPV